MAASMPLVDLLSTDRVVLDQNLASKKSVLEKAAKLLAQGDQSVSSRDIFEGLCQRERLGSTGLGHGVAIPHCRVGQSSVSGAFIRLTRPIDFDSPDASSVDLFFALAVPSQCSEAHLKLLASIAELFSDPRQREELRRATDFRQLASILTGESKSESS
ncbi:MAG TPA: PTS sugar transporter subunit IIA [Wenzhouxiangellaceae bacterium]|nr:PTS sugar transporter subunit IIA [Wenzhouxiangellaceae bacterium]